MGDMRPTMDNMADPILLEKIDKLFATGVGEHIALPQIVVVGDQSSGKSSVLEGLTGLPFPRDSGLCTRFATQITFRRAPTKMITVSIIPSRGSSEQHQEEVKNWSKADLEELAPAKFAQIMQEVHEVMGLGHGDQKGTHGTFSEDVLCLEICGPTEQLFSVIDVPGIFRKTTAGETTKQDQETVLAMVKRYMANPRSIMLTVVPANVDIATQEILTMAEEVDEEGVRTLGVLTKPDLVDSGAEKSVMELVKGVRHKLEMGWYILRNPGQKDIEDGTSDRVDIERSFFRDRAPWNTLDKDRVGVEALQVRLQEVLADKIRSEFPKVKSEIHKMLKKANDEHEELGGERETAAQQIHYLMKISMAFQKVVNSALSANYVGSDWFDQFPNLRFATDIVNRNEVVATILGCHGHSYQFKNDSKTDQKSVETTGDEPKELATKKVVLRFHDNFDELDELAADTISIPNEPARDIIPWLTNVYKGSRGFELGTFDSSLLAMTMKTQSSNWEAIAMGYIKDVISMAHRFIKTLLGLVCPDRRVQDGLLSVLMDGLFPRYQKALENVRFLLHVERRGTPATLNHYFNDNLQKSRQKRVRASVEGKSFTSDTHGGGPLVRIEDIVETRSMSNVQHVVQEVHDILESYYKVARKRFTDNLCMQAADYYLVTGPESPLRLFSPEFVAGLKEDQLMEIAGEDNALRRKRKALVKKILDLEAGKKVLS
ncbi:dynamin GTPase [Microthyrium microscopicum]|uniref:Dynamin GTPase n=1 Tax=Microthyrium microscopicum TaxID=703497 RepID=A0A6A6UF06_9PEZI|nr:dynamin GTPase [Microthyrium microscopicum]